MIPKNLHSARRTIQWLKVKFGTFTSNKMVRTKTVFTCLKSISKNKCKILTATLNQVRIGLFRHRPALILSNNHIHITANIRQCMETILIKSQCMEVPMVLSLTKVIMDNTAKNILQEKKLTNEEMNGNKETSNWTTKRKRTKKTKKKRTKKTRKTRNPKRVMIENLWMNFLNAIYDRFVCLCTLNISFCFSH